MLCSSGVVQQNSTTVCLLWMLGLPYLPGLWSSRFIPTNAYLSTSFWISKFFSPNPKFKKVLQCIACWDSDCITPTLLCVLFLYNECNTNIVFACAIKCFRTCRTLFVYTRGCWFWKFHPPIAYPKLPSKKQLWITEVFSRAEGENAA